MIDNTSEAGGIFQCSLCGLKEKYTFKGQKSPFNKEISFINSCYVMKDPFTPPNKEQFLILGSDCDKCGKPVCKSSDCSVFYKATYCSVCSQQIQLPVSLRT